MQTTGLLVAAVAASLATAGCTKAAEAGSAKGLEVTDFGYDDKAVYFADPNGLAEKDGLVSLTIYTAFSPASQAEDKIAAAEVVYQIDCRKKQGQVTAVQEFLATGARTTNLAFNDPQWNSIDPGTPGEAIWRAACTPDFLSGKPSTKDYQAYARTRFAERAAMPTN